MLRVIFAALILALLIFPSSEISQETGSNSIDSVAQQSVVDDSGVDLNSIQPVFRNLPAIGAVLQATSLEEVLEADEQPNAQPFASPIPVASPNLIPPPRPIAPPPPTAPPQPIAPPPIAPPTASNSNNQANYSPLKASLLQTETQSSPFNSSPFSSSPYGESFFSPNTQPSRPETPDEPLMGSKLPAAYHSSVSVTDEIQPETPKYFAEDSVLVDEPVLVEPTVVAPVVCSQCQSGSCAGCKQSSGGCGCRSGSRERKRTRLGRFIQGVHAGICNDDPCYQPEWTMLANASLFTDAVRPQSRQRFRWDYNDEYLFPDRAEFLWARSGSLGPAPERSINFHELTAYVETGSDKFSFFVETPYRSISLDSGGHFAGVGDITVGTKTLLHDTALTQVALQFETQVPSATPTKGLSNGHVSLEPSLLFGIQASPKSFLQAQIGEWIPIAGDTTFAGALLRYSVSYNRTLFEMPSNTSLTGTIEYSGISFQDGAYTDPDTLLPVSASNESIGLLGTGLRLNICDKMNFGFGVQYGVTDISPRTAFRTEIQFRH